MLAFTAVESNTPTEKLPESTRLSDFSFLRVFQSFWKTLTKVKPSFPLRSLILCHVFQTTLNTQKN